MVYLIYTFLTVTCYADVNLTSLANLEEFFDEVTDYSNFNRTLANYWSKETQKVENYENLLREVRDSRKELILKEKLN